jgi:hypothetical protein
MGSNCTFLIGGCPLVLPSPSIGRFAMILLNQFNLQSNFSFLFFLSFFFFFFGNVTVMNLNLHKIRHLLHLQYKQMFFSIKVACNSKFKLQQLMTIN